MDPMSIFSCKDESFEVVDAAAREEIENIKLDLDPWCSIVANSNARNISNNEATDVAPRIEIPSNGIYIVIGYVEWEGNSTGGRSIRINADEQGSSDYVTVQAVSNTSVRHQIVFIHDYSAGQILSLGVRQNSGSTLTITKRRLTVYRLTTSTVIS